LRSPGGPFQYVLHNAYLKINQASIAGTPRGIPYPNTWNGAVWTLYYEFLCYLMLGALAFLGLLRRRVIVVLLTAVTWMLEFGVSIGLNKELITLNSTVFFLGHVAVFVPLFLTGSLIYLYRDKVPDARMLALVLGAIYVASLWWPLDLPTNRYTGQIGGAALWAPALVYPLLWLGIHLPFHRVGATNDYSYGIYIYAWPVQQLLVTQGVQRWGYPIYTLLCVCGTLPFAVMSWWIIEKRALALKKLQPATVLRHVRQRLAPEAIES
jgi:peptidoglycan/LPS O-acetylase OafA/YrhL